MKIGVQFQQTQNEFDEKTKKKKKDCWRKKTLVQSPMHFLDLISSVNMSMHIFNGEKRKRKVGLEQAV